MGKTWQQIVNEAFTQPVLFVLKQLYDCLQPWKHYSRSLSEQKYYMANYEYLMERIIRYSRIDKLIVNLISYSMIRDEYREFIKRNKKK